MTARGQDFAIQNAEGQVIVRVSLIFTLYFENGFDLDVRRRIGECVEYYRSMCSDNLRWIRLPDAKRWHRIDPTTVAAYQTWLRQGMAQHDWYMSLRGGRNPHEASEFQVNVFAKEGPLPKLTYLQMVVPITWLQTPSVQFVDVCVNLCRMLRPYNGYGGYGFAESSDIGVVEEGQPIVYSLAKRFPGVEVDDPLSHKNFVHQGIKGVNWLTVLGSTWVERVGGLAILRDLLGPAFIFHEYDGGLVIQAGPAPQMGDVNQKMWPKLYAELARLLKPIRITKHGSFHNYGTNRFTRETSEAWLARFDEEPWPDIEPFVEGATVLEAGTFRGEGFGAKVQQAQWAPDTAAGTTGKLGRATLVSAGPIVPMKLGVNFGMRCQLSGMPVGEPARVEVQMVHPPISNPRTGVTTTVDRWDWDVPIGIPLYTGWGFDEPWSMAPGIWTLRVVHGGRVLVEQDFDVVPTADKGEAP